MIVLFIMVSYLNVEYDSTIDYGQLPDGRVWQYDTLWLVTTWWSMAVFALWSVTRWYSMAVLYIMHSYQMVEYGSSYHFGQLLDVRV